MRDYLEASHVLAVSSCTAALHLSLVALGVGPGDEVITTSITWPATANVIVHCGATPVFADVRDDTLNIDPEHVRELVNERTKAILPVDLYGQPADLDPLLALGLPLVEDAAHAAESRYRGRKVGAIADLTCFSLYATKNIAAGEGGLIATEPRRPRRGARRPARDAPRPRLALRHRRSRLQGEPQRRARVDRARAARQGRAGTRRSAAGRSRSTTTGSPSSTGSSRSRATRATSTPTTSTSCASRFADRDEVQRALTDENIGTSIHFLPVHLLSAYRDRLAPHQPPLPVTERAGAEVLSLPLSPAHSDDDIRDAVAALRRVHERLAR